MVKLEVKRTSDGGCACWVGGGAKHKTFAFRVVLCRYPVDEEYTLEKIDVPVGIFFRNVGHLSCSDEQALVPLEVDDYIVIGKGSLPIEPTNPDITLTTYRVKSFMNENGTWYAECGQDDQIDLALIPKSVIKGASEYHNREGTFFARKSEEFQTNQSITTGTVNLYGKDVTW